MGQFAARKKYIVLTLAIFCANLLADRLSKAIAVAFLKGKEPLGFLQKLVVLTYTENSGAFLSLGASWNIYVKYFLLLIVPIAVCAAALVYLSLKETRLSRIIAGSCVIGGGIGNLVDRLFHEFKVIDFMNFGIGPLRTGILNVADMSVTFGIIALLIFEIKKNGQRRQIAG